MKRLRALVRVIPCRWNLREIFVVMGLVAIAAGLFSRIRIVRTYELVRPSDPVCIAILTDAPLQDIEHLLDANPASIHEFEVNRESLLYIAAERGILGVVELLLDRGANPNGVDGGAPPLIGAIIAEDAQIAQRLIEAGASVSRRVDRSKLTVRDWAISENDPEMLDALGIGTPRK